MASLQLPAQYTQLPVPVIDQLETLIWCIPEEVLVTDGNGRKGEFTGIDHLHVDGLRAVPPVDEPHHHDIEKGWEAGQQDKDP